MNRRRSMLFASGKIPEGWYKPKDTPAGIFVCVYKNKQIYSIEASVFNADPSSFVDIIMGITVVTDKTRFIFSEKVLDYRTKVWDYGDVASPSLIQGVTAASNASGAVADYKGKENSVPAMVVMMLIRGIVQVLGIELGKMGNGMLSGLAGLSHIGMMIAFFLLLFAIKRELIRKQ